MFSCVIVAPDTYACEQKVGQPRFIMLYKALVVCVAIVMTQAIQIPVVPFGTVPQTAAPVGIRGALPSEEFPYHEKLSDNYTLYWNFNTTHITFEMVVRTTGWIGFGISPNGAMRSSDVIIGGVEDGYSYFDDRHGEGHFLPAKDDSQDWTLLMAREFKDYTALKVIRKLNTYDTQDDLPIRNGETHVIFAYSHRDGPSGENYHAENRGTKSVNLLSPSMDRLDKTLLPADVKTLEFTNRNYLVPSSDTTYRCTFWKLPDLQDKKHHVIRFEPIIQAGHENLLHHIIVWHCNSGLNENELSQDAFLCYSRRPRQANNCEQVFLSWAIGGKAFNYPSNAGYPLGIQERSGYFLMETHYDNPRQRSDFVDNSGLRVYLTTQLKQHDTGVLMVGITLFSNHRIPPNQELFLSKGICTEDCLGGGLKSTKINVFANLLHAHLLGSKLRLRHYRNQRELPVIQEDNNYDFNYQETRMLPNEITVEKGDRLVVECEYDSRGRTTVTYGGFSTRDEMCYSFVLYYPQVPFSRCTSSDSNTQNTRCL